MSIIRNLFGWSRLQAPGEPQQAAFPPYTLTWNDFPDLVQLEILKYLDRRTLNNLRQISASARFLTDYIYGLRVILPTRDWTFGFAQSAGRKTFTDKMLQYILLQMEGKRIHTFEMNETPPHFLPFPFQRFIRYPRSLLHVKLKFVDIDLINEILQYCSNLRSFEYKSGYQRPLPHGPIATMLFRGSFLPVPAPSTYHNLVEKVRDFQPDILYNLPHLRELSLTIFQMSTQYGSDWGNVLYLLLGLPSLPSLTTFRFSLEPGWKLGWKTHLLLLCCVAEFLSKIPRIKGFHFQSQAVGGDDSVVDNFAWLTMMREIIKQFGSDSLKEAAEGTIGQTPIETFLMFPKSMFQIAGRNLAHLNVLDIKTLDDRENDVFTRFINRLSHVAPLNSCTINDCTPRDEETLETEEPKSKVYKLFTYPLLRHPPELEAPRPAGMPDYRLLTQLCVQCNFLPNTTLSLNKIVERMPLLKSLVIGNYNPNPGHTFLHYDATPAETPFKRLEVLDLDNLSIGDLRSEEPSLTRLIMQCRNLHSLNIRYWDQNNSWVNHVNRGTHIKDLLAILTSMPKLTNLQLHRVYFEMSPVEASVTDALENEDHLGMIALKETGGVLRQCPIQRRGILVNHMLRDVTDYDFAFNTEMCSFIKPSEVLQPPQPPLQQPQPPLQQIGLPP